MLLLRITGMFIPRGGRSRGPISLTDSFAAGFLFIWKMLQGAAMSCLLACFFLLVQAVAAKPTEKPAPEMQRDMTAFLQLVNQNIWEENINLTSLPCEDMKTQVWTTLRLKNQGLTSFPACLPEHLEHLDLSVNLLPEFHSQDVAYLPMLQVLSLRQNNIQQVMWEAGSLSNLHYLDLSFNQLSSLPECNSFTMENLKWLSLAGNPITEIQPFAFSCYPQLHFVNLSSTWLGKDGQQGIGESAFAIRLLHVGDSNSKAESAINVLDLSMTFLERIHEDWIKDLPRLSSLYLTNMRRLRSLEGAVFQHMLHLKELDCRDSPALSLVETESFRHTPQLAFLLLQNCNLSSLHEWDLGSSNNLVINLYGNPLTCHCENSWLIARQDKIVLQRESETVCYTAAETKSASLSGSKLLSNLYEDCQEQESAHSTPLFTQGNTYSTSLTITIDTLQDASALPHEWHSISFAPESTPMNRGDTTHVTLGDRSKQGSTKTDLLAYKEEIINGSTDMSLIITAAAITSSAKPGQHTTEQSLVDTVETGERKQDATTVNTIIRLEETQRHIDLESPTTEPTEQEGLFSPLSTAPSDQTMPSLQIPTKTSTQPNLAIADNPNYYTDDYDYDKEEKESVSDTLGPCDYDPCRHLQKPCVDLQELSPCLCPGISDEFTIPDPPRLWDITEIRDTSVAIHWCAPYSAVRSYQLAYKPQGSKKNYTISGEIYTTARQYTLYNLLPASTYQVCVIASNKAGPSTTTDGNGQSAPCSTFSTKSSYKPVFAALGVTSGVFLITTIMLSVCLCRKWRAPRLEQYNMDLVSYKNPAFDYSLK
ncbi:leucine-rich repeat neuronal protein 4 [Anolis carolinensis]|uniref:leucine-rich repeat neuronal protein 4 n=1 Tax=Anolis carolinensis TaxID=28377 RepID=UPI002F2B571E